MSEQKNNTPNLRFPEFSGEWEEKKLGEVTRNEDSKRRPVSKIDRAAGGYPYYGANGIQDHVNDYIFDGDYLLVGEDGTVLTKENTPVINWASGKFWVNNHAHVLSQKDDTSLKLISYLLSRVKIDGLVTGIPPKLNQDNLNTISIPLPPSPAEQDKIASCLSAMDDLIAAQAEKVEALKEKKTGLMQQLFPQPGETTPRLRFPEFTGEWEVKKLGEVVNSFKTGKLDANAMVEGGKYRFYTCAKDYSYIDSYAFEGDSIMIAGNGAHLGYVHHYEGKFNAYQRTYVLNNFKCDSNYLENCIRYYLPNRIRLEKKEGNMPYIVLSTLTDMTITIPPTPAEQKKIASCLSALDDQIAAETEKLTALKDYKKGLMQQLFPQPAK